MEPNLPPHAGKVTIAAAFLALCCAFTAPNEGTVLHAVQDTGGIWSICSGHTYHVKKGDTATPAQCKIWLNQDEAEAINEVNFLTDDAPIPPNAKKVFVDEVFNTGGKDFRGSTMVKMIKAGNYDAACRQFPRWHYAGGKNCAIRANNCYGIVTRRAQQMATCLKGLKS